MFESVDLSDVGLRKKEEKLRRQGKIEIVHAHIE